MHLPSIKQDISFKGSVKECIQIETTCNEPGMGENNDHNEIFELPLEDENDINGDDIEYALIHANASLLPNVLQPFLNWLHQ